MKRKNTSNYKKNKNKTLKKTKAGKLGETETPSSEKTRILERMKKLMQANERIMNDFMEIDNTIDVLERVSGPNIQNAINELLEKQDQLRLLDEQYKQEYETLRQRVILLQQQKGGKKRTIKNIWK